MTDLKIYISKENDWQTYKNLRLQALQDSPDSFCTTYEQMVDATDEFWICRCQLKQGSSIMLPLIAELDGIPCGMAWAITSEVESGTAHIYQMWVSPQARGHGIARAMLEKMLTWAEKHQLEKLELSVTTTNRAAIALYESMGFETCGELVPLREHSALQVQSMALGLS
ncbi:N-acetyltransferase family protein [Endozoicomonadaceae bacterium StTr2]